MTVHATTEGEAAGECFGGVARLKTAIDAKRSELGENVIVLDAGDPFQGSLFYTTYKVPQRRNSWKRSDMMRWPLATTNSMTARRVGRLYRRREFSGRVGEY